MIDFAVIGFPKCGTTSIEHNIGRCNSVYFIPGEPKRIDLPHYYFPPNKKVGFKFPSAIYELDEWSDLFIRNHTRLIICWRNPIEHLLTFYNYRKNEVKKNVRWIQEYKRIFPTIDLDNMQLTDVINRKVDFLSCSLDKSTMETYTASVFEKFRNNRILVINFDELRANPKIFYGKICAFLNVPVTELPSIFTIENINENKGEKVSYDDLTAEQKEILQNQYKNTFSAMNRYTYITQEKLYNSLANKK